MSKILVTGGAGFIGSHLVEYHLDRGDEVRVVDDLSTGTADNVQLFSKNKNYDFREGDIVDWEGMKETVEWAECIYHMASLVGMMKVMEDPLRVLTVNVNGTERILKFMNPLQKIIVASSSEVYSVASGDRFNHARWNYAISKLTTEALALSYGQKNDLDVCVVRIFNTIGKRQKGHYGMVVPRFVRAAVRGDDIEVFGDDGEQVRCFCDVEDTVVMLHKLAEASSSGMTFNVGSNHPISILDLAITIRKLAKSESSVVFVPYEIAYPEGYEDVRERIPDLNSLFEFLSFKPKWKLSDTLAKLIKKEKK